MKNGTSGSKEENSDSETDSEGYYVSDDSSEIGAIPIWLFWIFVLVIQ